MAILKKASFGYGELDPALHDKTDIKSYYSGLKTARNVLLSKTGRIVNAPGTYFGADLGPVGGPVKIYAPKFTQFRPTAEGGIKNYETNFVLVFKDLEVQGYNLVFRNGIDDREGYDLVEFTNPPVVASWGTSDILYLNFESIGIPDRKTDTVRSDRVAVSGPTEFAPLQFLYIHDDVITIESVKTSLAYPTIKRMTSAAFVSGNVEPSYNYATSAYSGGSQALYMKDINKLPAAITAQIGHAVEYGVTAVSKSGVESEVLVIPYHAASDNTSVSFFKLPTNDEFNAFYIYNLTINSDPTNTVNTTDRFYKTISHINIYRRPKNSAAAGGATRNGSDGNSFGLIGRVLWTPPSSDWDAGEPFNIGFTDFGQEADYSNPPPEKFGRIRGLTFDVDDIYTQFLSSYNRRLVVGVGPLVGFSRINHPSYFYKDFPLSSATSFILDIGDRNPTVYAAVEYNGLYVFASDGIYYGGNDTPVSSLNPVLKRIDDIKIDQYIKPIVTPYGILFVDDSTKTVKTLAYNDNTKSVEAQEVSIFSDHLFYNRTIKHWAYSDGEFSHLFVVLDNGDAVTYSYNNSLELNAWCRHDTDGEYQQVVKFTQKNYSDVTLMYTVVRNGNLLLEFSSRRNRTTLNKQPVAFAHSSVFKVERADLGLGWDQQDKATVTLSAVSGLWTTTVEYLTASTAYWAARVGKTIGIYNDETDSYYYLTILSVSVGVKVTFTVTGSEVPTNLRSVAVTAYICHTVITGLDHLDGKAVSVISDNVVIGSPNNDIDSYTTYTVTGGSITLPTPRVWSIVGLPYTSDIETLSVDSKDGALALSAKIANEVVVRYVRTRGGYAAGTFPANDKVNGMEQGYEWDTRDLVNKPLAEKTRAIKYRPFSEWQLNGRICLRQVDPLPIEISSILIDVSKG